MVTPRGVQTEHTAGSQRTGFPVVGLQLMLAPVCPLPGVTACRRHREPGRTAEPSSSTAPRDDGPARHCHRHRLGTMSEPGLLSSCISKEKCVRVPAGWWESTWIHLRTLNRDAHQKSCLRGVTTRCPREEPELTWDLGATVNPEEALAARMRLRLPPGRSGATPQNEALPGA